MVFSLIILASPSTAGIGGAGESPFRRECAARPEEWSREAKPRKAHNKNGKVFFGDAFIQQEKVPQKEEEEKKSGIIAAVDALLFVVEVDVAGSNQLLGICFAAANHVGIACAQSKFIGF